MSGLVIAQFTVTDPEKFKEYGSQVKATVDAFDGEIIIRGGEGEAVEGDWPAGKLVIVKFPSVEIAKAWYHSDAYQPLVKLRQSASTGNMAFVEGL